MIKGFKMSPATKIKMSLVKRGKPSNMAGKKHSEESKEKMRKKHLGKLLSTETKKKMSEVKLGIKRGPMSEAHRLKLSKNHADFKGPKSPTWKGGVTPINRKIRNSLEYKIWRKAVFERDGYQCIWGGKEHGDKLNADHIKPFSLYPELRLAIDNGRTLCEACHKTTETFAGRINKINK